MQQTRTDLLTEIAAKITANGAGGITGPILNAILTDMVDSDFNILSDAGGSPANVREATLELTSAEVLALNTTPQEILPAPGVGKAIQLQSAFVHVIFGGIAYAVNRIMQLISANGSTAQAQNNILNATVDSMRHMTIQFVGTTSVQQIIENDPLEVSVAAGNPTTGNSPIKIFITYRIVDVS